MQARRAVSRPRILRLCRLRLPEDENCASAPLSSHRVRVGGLRFFLIFASYSLPFIFSTVGGKQLLRGPTSAKAWDGQKVPVSSAQRYLISHSLPLFCFRFSFVACVSVMETFCYQTSAGYSSSFRFLPHLLAEFQFDHPFAWCRKDHFLCVVPHV